MTSGTGDDKSYRNCVNFLYAPTAPAAAGRAPKFRLPNLGTPKPAALQKIALWTDMPIRKTIGRHQTGPFVLTDLFLSHRRQSEAVDLQPRLQGLVMNALVVQQAFLDGKLVPCLESSRDYGNWCAIFSTKIDNRARAVARKDLTAADLANGFHCLGPLSCPPSSRTYDVDASTERKEFGVGFCFSKRALFPRTAAASADVRSASP